LAELGGQLLDRLFGEPAIWVFEQADGADAKLIGRQSQFLLPQPVQISSGGSERGCFAVGEAQERELDLPLGPPAQRGSQSKSLVIGMGADGEH